MRFALKSRRGPHVPLAVDASKQIKREIDRRFDVVKDIKFEPCLVHDEDVLEDNEATPSVDRSNSGVYDHVYRMRAVDALVTLESAIIEGNSDSAKKRPPGQDLRFYLIRMAKEGGPLFGCDTKLIHEFVDMYNQARHEPSPVFRAPEFQQYMALLNRIRDNIVVKRTPSSKKSNLSTPNHRPKATQVAINGRTTVRIITPISSGPSESEPNNETSV
jgi:hypothetical protein